MPAARTTVSAVRGPAFGINSSDPILVLDYPCNTSAFEAGSVSLSRLQETDGRGDRIRVASSRLVGNSR